MRTILDRIAQAHFAGFFDSDGCVTIGVQRKDGGIYYASVVKIEVSKERKKVILRKMQGLYGGNLTETDGRLLLNFRAEESSSFLEALFPFLILKKPQAALYFKFRKMMTQRVVSRHQHDLRRMLAEKLNGMHRSFDGPLGRPRPDWTVEETNAFAAGLMDGDGSFSHTSSEHRYRVCTLNGKPRTLPEWLLNVYGGSLAPYQTNWGRQWRWSIYCSSADAFVAKIHPYLYRSIEQDDDRVRTPE